MIDLKAVQLELAQARQARIDAQLAGCEVEELADNLRQSRAPWRRPERIEGGLSPYRSILSP
jgi:hypothetical protein